MKKYYCGMYDIIFKNAVCIEENKDILINIIETVTGIKVDEIILDNNELTNNNKYVRNKVVDVLVKSKDAWYNIEINNNYYECLRERNLGYIANIYSESIKKNTSLIEIPCSIQINLSNAHKNVEKISEYRLRTINGTIWTNKLIIYEINVAKLVEAYYNNDKKEIDKYKSIIMLGLNEKDLKDLSKGDNMVKKYEEKVNSLNSEPDIINWLTEEEEDKLIKNTIRDAGIEQGMKTGIEQGIEQGVKTGITEVAKKMKDNKYAVKDIALCTGLSIEEIEKL